MATNSEILAMWIANSKYDNLPFETIKSAKRYILDCIGTALAGSKEPVAIILKDYLNAIKSNEQCTIVGLGMKSSVVESAMANGILSHALDYDDLVIPARGGGGPHISAVVLPTVLSVAEHQMKSGKDMILAYILGCEVAYRVGRAVDPSHYNFGWHTTGTEGIFGAVTAACKLFDMDPGSVVFAIGIAASEASGLRKNFGTMTKFLHAGQAAAKGIRAALLAKYGFTSSRTIFEGQTGFCNVFSAEPKEDEITKDLDKFVCIPQMRMKLYPCCAASHSAIYATQQIVGEHSPDSENIANIRVFCDPQMSRILTYHSPKTIDEGRFSAQFPIALALSKKKVNMSGFIEKNVQDPNIRALMSKIHLIPKDDLKARSIHSRAAIVEVTLKDGGCFSNRCDHPPGTPQNPISENDLMEKFCECAERVFSRSTVEEILQIVLNLENMYELDELIKILGKSQNST